MTIIQQLMDNEKAFCKMSDEMQAKANKIGPAEFERLDIGIPENWLDGIHKFCPGYTYRLSSSYKEEKPGIVERIITADKDDVSGWMQYRYTDAFGNSLLLSSAINDPDFIGFKFEDGTVMGSPVKYSVPGITSHGYYALYEDLKTSQALEHHAISVLFRGQE